VKKDIPQASLTCGLEISTGQTKILLAACYQTTANFEHWKKNNKQLKTATRTASKKIYIIVTNIIAPDSTNNLKW
jgi:hypothetical protein